MYDTIFEKKRSRAIKRGIICADTMIIKGVTVNQIGHPSQNIFLLI